MNKYLGLVFLSLPALPTLPACSGAAFTAIDQAPIVADAGNGSDTGVVEKPDVDAHDETATGDVGFPDAGIDAAPDALEDVASEAEASPEAEAGLVCAMTVGPTLGTQPDNIGSGITFHVTAPVKLFGFVFESSGLGSTIHLYENGTVVQSLPVPAGYPHYHAVVVWPLALGKSYQLANDNANEFFAAAPFPWAEGDLVVEGGDVPGYWIGFVSLQTCQ